MDGIEDLKNQLLATAGALNDRMNQINEKCDKGDINSNNIINRVSGAFFSLMWTWNSEEFDLDIQWIS